MRMVVCLHYTHIHVLVCKMMKVTPSRLSLPVHSHSFMCTAMNLINISLSVAPPLMERSYQLIPNGF